MEYSEKTCIHIDKLYHLIYFAFIFAHDHETFSAQTVC